MNQKITTQNALMKSGEKRLANTDHILNANKLANVRRDKMNKKRLTEAEIEDIKKTVRKQTKTEKPKPEDVAEKMENLTTEQTENTIKQIIQGKQVNQQNQNPEMEQPHMLGICQKKGKKLTQKQRKWKKKY